MVKFQIFLINFLNLKNEKLNKNRDLIKINLLFIQTNFRKLFLN